MFSNLWQIEKGNETSLLKAHVQETFRRVTDQMTKFLVGLATSGRDSLMNNGSSWQIRSGRATLGTGFCNCSCGVH